MLRPITNDTIYSRITVTRMRYRGPIESLKINKFKADIHKDLSVLRDKFNTVYDRLNTYVGEVVDGISDTIIVEENNQVIYNGKEKENVAFLNHDITVMLRED